MEAEQRSVYERGWGGGGGGGGREKERERERRGDQIMHVYNIIHRKKPARAIKMSVTHNILNERLTITFISHSRAQTSNNNSEIGAAYLPEAIIGSCP